MSLLKIFHGWFLLLALAIFASPEVLAKYHVYIINNLGDDTTLTIHCRSKDDDLGTHSLPFEADFHWSFHINIGRTTLFYCDMNWDYIKGHFDVFVAKRDTVRCGTKCVWRVDRDGLYLYIAKDEEYELQYRWP